ncbi:hypothetical protein DM01DRAFT_326585 [Hesseltinella vesiculosa]|uniref:Uncharacterized protein n=1 Tax=Hesseltinella vesiculosa TaxID=101127 RepID=A0A1X2GI19_9FUNG|nr:hypothetical protein DM01DRAFT_326585 [Hesseltinella vesiculosa]
MEDKWIYCWHLQAKSPAQDQVIEWLDLQIDALMGSLTVDRHTARNHTRLGYCQHPKHFFYRVSSAQTLPAGLPRRGRPPKGTKGSEQHVSHPILMTTRPLPKRLAAVVGQSNLFVCLTCLKRSDVDLDYLGHPLYVGPQPIKRSKPAQYRTSF